MLDQHFGGLYGEQRRLPPCPRQLRVLLCLTLCDPMDCNPPGSSVHRILQARILEWVAISSPEIKPRSSALQANYLPLEPPGKPAKKSKTNEQRGIVPILSSLCSLLFSIILGLESESDLLPFFFFFILKFSMFYLESFLRFCSFWLRPCSVYKNLLGILA